MKEVEKFITDWFPNLGPKIERLKEGDTVQIRLHELIWGMVNGTKLEGLLSDFVEKTLKGAEMSENSEYLELCCKAAQNEKIRALFSELPPGRRWGCGLAFRSFIGMIVPCEPRKEEGLVGIIPETLAIRTWCKLHEDVTILINLAEEGQEGFQDEGFPIFGFKQLIGMFDLLIDDNTRLFCGAIYKNDEHRVLKEMLEKLLEIVGK